MSWRPSTEEAVDGSGAAGAFFICGSGVYRAPQSGPKLSSFVCVTLVIPVPSGFIV